MHATCIPHVEGGLSAREHAHVARFVTSHGSSLCKVRAPLPHDADGCMRAFAGMRFSPTRSKKRACVLVRSVASRVESSRVESSRVQVESSRVESSRVESSQEACLRLGAIGGQIDIHSGPRVNERVEVIVR